jgi:opacity protein-like surface antigen
MRSNWMSVPAIGVLALALGQAANAADVGRLPGSSLPPPPLLQSAPLLVDEFGSGWYLRGDVGYRFKNEADTVTNVDTGSVISAPELDNSWLFGIGGGYKFDWFRTDVTLDYSKTDFEGRRGSFTTGIESITGLLNVYGDLGTWFGFSPYIGIGAGFARLEAKDFHLSGADIGESHDTWNFAWAYMAGVSYKLFANSHIDVGYRHINMGDVSTGIDGAGNQLNFKKVAADEVRVGFRYVID